MKAALKVSQWSWVAVVLLLGGCAQMSHSWYLSNRDRDIKDATEAIEAGRDDAHRATGYVQRGRAYSDKARYSRFFKLIPADEYGRLFDLAIKDLDQAVALAPGSAESYFGRGMAYYERASLEESKDTKRWFDPAGADFKKAFEKDSRHYIAMDMAGVVHEQTGALDEAIRDYTQEMALNPLGKARLAGIYCVRGSQNQAAKSSMQPSRITRSRSRWALPMMDARVNLMVNWSSSTTLRAGRRRRFWRPCAGHRRPNGGSIPICWRN